MITQRLKIFLVDDEPLLTRAIKLILERNDEFQVLCENDSTAAFTKIEAAQPDVVILDIIMPEVTGIDLAARLRSSPSTQHLPILFYSSCHSAPEGFLLVNKPATREQLVHAIRGSLEAGRLPLRNADIA